MWNSRVVKYAHLYGSQCNPLLHSAPTHSERYEPLFLGTLLSPDPLMDCPAHCHLGWLKRCLLGAQNQKTLKFLDTHKVYKQIIIGAYRVLRQRTWQHRGVHGNRAEPVPLSSRGWSCLCSSLSHRLRIRGSPRWPMSATPYWLSGENMQNVLWYRKSTHILEKEHIHAVVQINTNTSVGHWRNKLRWQKACKATNDSQPRLFKHKKVNIK